MLGAENEYADAMTDTHRDVEDELSGENASSRFNRAFRIPSQGFWKR